MNPNSNPSSHNAESVSINQEREQHIDFRTNYADTDNSKHIQALIAAEKALDITPHPSLPKLEIHMDEGLNYLAEHSMTITAARRIAYDFQHDPQIARAYWGGAAVAVGSALIGMGLLKNPAAAAYMTATGTEALGFGAVGGMAGGSMIQTLYTGQQLRDRLPSASLPQFKAVRMYGP